MESPLPLSISPASLAVSPTTVLQSIRFVVGVASQAMRLATISCATVPSDIDRASRVLLCRDSFNMGGVGTGPVTAEVVTLKTERDRADEVFVGPTVGEHQAISTMTRTADAKRTVAPSILAASPLPATVVEEANLRPEASRKAAIAELRNARLGLHRKVTPFGVVQPDAPSVAAAFIIHRKGGTHE